MGFGVGTLGPPGRGDHVVAGRRVDIGEVLGA
jgi:hypothetical protein